jgi:hypothetical protein
LNTLTASSILASVAKQLLLHLDILRAPWPSQLKERLECDFQQGRKCLLPHELTTILLELLPSFDKTIIFVDGLDECVPKESNQLLHSLKQLLCNQNSKLKVFVTSREGTDVSQYLPGCLRISVSEENVASDIHLYVEREVASNIKTTTPSIIQDINRNLVKGSQGM